MDPLVATVIGIVSPYLAKGAEEFAKSVGKETFEKTKRLVSRMSKWWAQEPVAEAAAHSFASDPKRYGAVLAGQLAHDVASNQVLAEELKILITDMGPAVDVVQHMEVARGVTGADVKELVSGSLRVTQTIRDATNVTGFKADRIG